MPDTALEAFLTSTKTKTSGVEATKLKLLGKEAASEFLNQGTSLNDAVLKIAQANPDLTPQHVHRITEAANQEAYDQLFQKEAGAVKNVVFDYGDPVVILAHLEGQSRPAVKLSAAQAYGVQVQDFREGLHEDIADDVLADAFGVEQEKVASEHVDASADVRQWQQLRGAIEHVSAEEAEVRTFYKEAAEQFDAVMQQALQEGVPLEDVGAVVEFVSGPEKMASMLPHIIVGMKSALRNDPDLEIHFDAEKVAAAQSREVDLDSQLAKATRHLDLLQQRLGVVKAAKAELERQYEDVDKRVRQ